MINILVVEDNILQLNALKRIIENTEIGQPICTYTASGYDEAVEIISSAHFDIFFLDILMHQKIVMDHILGIVMIIFMEYMKIYVIMIE